MQLLKQLYFIHSPSGNEHGMQGFIRHYLTCQGIKFNVDKFNQTYCLSNKNKPLLVAHTDQVSSKPITKLIENDGFIAGDSNLGADDKNGIWIILNILKRHPDINFIFSVEEETGGKVYNLLTDKTVKHIPYALVFDRKGSSDIIGYDNGYCSPDFEEVISEIGIEYGYKPTMGVFSDCDSISDYLNCVNLSCGYHNAHSNQEYTDKKALLNALDFGLKLVTSDIKKMDLFRYDEVYCHECGSELHEDILGYACPMCLRYIYD